MARLARVVAPGLPHHVTQRGNRRQTVFFSDEDYEVYRAFAAEHCAAAGVAVWAYCLMPNHVHLILVPADAAAHLAARDDGLVAVAPLLELAGDWRAFLEDGLEAADLEAIRAHERTGRPLGSAAFLEGLEARLGRTLKKRRAGRKSAKTRG